MTRMHHQLEGSSTLSVSLPSISMPMLLDDNDKKLMPSRRISKAANGKKNTQLSDSRIHLEPLRPPTAGGSVGGRTGTRLTVSTSSGQVSWGSAVMEPSSTISENLSAFQELDRKLQFYKTLSVLKMREAVQSEQALQQMLTSLLYATALVLDATAVVLYSLSDAQVPMVKVIACSSSGPNIVGFQTSLETFALRGLVEHFNAHDGNAPAMAPAGTYVSCLQNLDTYEISCDVDSVLGFSTASVLAGVLPDEHGQPRFVMEARSTQEGVTFSKEFMHITLTAVENIVYPFELRQALARHTRAQAVVHEVLEHAVDSFDTTLENHVSITGERTNSTHEVSERAAKAETRRLHSLDVAQLTAAIMAVAPSVCGVCLVALPVTTTHKCEVLATNGPGFEDDRREALCALVSSTDTLFQRLVQSTHTHERLDLSDEVALCSALGIAATTLLFLPVPFSHGTTPSGLFCLVSSSPDPLSASMLEVEPLLPLQVQLKSILAAIALVLAAKQRSDDLHASTRQKRQLLTLCRSHFLAESVRDPSNLVALICEIGSAMFHTAHVTLYVSDTIKHELWSLSSLSSVNGLRIPYGRGIAGHVAATKKALTVHRPYEDPRFDRSFDTKFGFKTESLLTQPVLNRAGETVGVLQAVNFNQFPAASASVADYDDEVMAAYLRFVAHALHVNSSLIIFAKVQADYRANRAAPDSVRESGECESNDNKTVASGAEGLELGLDAKHEVAAVHSLLDMSGFDEAKRISRSKWSTFAFACWALGRFITLRVNVKTRMNRVAQIRREKIECEPKDNDEDEDDNDDNDDDDDIEDIQEDTSKRFSRPYFRNRTASVVRASRAHSLVTRWHRMTMDQGGFQMEELLRDSFDPLSKSISELENYSYQLFEGLVLIGTFRIEERKLRTFIGELASKYRDVPYHSFYHGFDVALASYALMRSPEVLSVIKEIEALSLLIAALGHDADHPGNDNQFEVDSNSDLALRYNDISVLENHHAATTFAVLKMECCNILSGLSASARGSVRTHVVRCILGTDMKHHTKLLSELAVVGSVRDFENVPEGRQLLLNMIIHGADLGSVGRPLRLTLKWVHRVCTEFAQQAERSAELGLNVPQHLCNLQDEASRCRLQMNFIDYLVSPLWVAISGLIPAAKPVLDNMQTNRLYFSEQATLLATKPQSSRS